MTQNEHNRNLLVVCYPQGWHWGLSVEFLNSQALAGEFYDVIDASFVGENLFFVKIKKIIGRYKFYKESIKFLTKGDFRIIDFNKANIKNFIGNGPVIDHEPLTTSPAYNTIIESYGSMDLEQIKKSLRGLRIINREIRTSNKMFERLSKLDVQGYEKVITVNGRFNKNATVLRWCKKNHLSYNLLEFGTLTKNTFEIYEKSPHSMVELQDKVVKYWNHSSDPLKINKAKIYFTNMIETKSSSGINFRKKMLSGKVPSFSGKKICVFFASSEYEYAGVNEEVPTGNFSTQVEAFRGLLDVLNLDEWDVYLRRHPKKNSSSKIDGEKFIWAEFYEQKSVYIIEPDSDIDSLSLGNSANLIVTYWSTINMEFLARENQNSINLGPTSWSRLLPSRYLATREEILKFISGEKKPFSLEDLLPWAYFMSDFGTEFKIISTNISTGKWTYIT